MKDKDLLEFLLKDVTRFEVIDHSKKMRGRYVVEYGIKVEVSIQDDGRTMKVFLNDQNK
jgi:hypothetical protein